jgi:hemerythrin-like metal-binding protein
MTGNSDVTLTQLAKALVNEEFVYYYQPKVSMVTGQISGAEALIRWHKPDGSVIPPGKFIPLAESTGFISEMTLNMFEKLLVDVTIIHDLMPDLSISFNASAKDFSDARLTDKIKETALKKTVNTGRIEVELTETILMEEDATIRENLLALHELGVPIAMDDFGTGFSTIDTLSKWPFSTLKIDQGVVSRMQRSDRDLTIIQSSILMAHKLGLEVVAEGIETEETYLALQSAGCKIAQGYLFSKPLPLLEFIQFLAAGTHWPALPVGLVHMAQLDHIQWRKQVVDCVCAVSAGKNNGRHIRGNPDMNPRKCRLGKWYYSAGRKFEQIEAYQLLEEPHTRLHKLATEIIQTASQGNSKDKLMPKLKELTSLSTQVLGLLQQLESEIVLAPSGLYETIHEGSLFKKVLLGEVSRIEWSDDFNMGINSIDEQHMQLITVVNDLIDQANAETVPQDTGKTINALEEYSISHFRHEERFLEQYGYPDYNNHMEAHRGFKIKVESFNKLPLEGFGAAVVEYLSGWLTNHILVEDMKYKTFFAEQGLLKDLNAPMP